jgi:ABC-type glycerol-3-phosphate transport system substrate-binding protein
MLGPAGRLCSLAVAAALAIAGCGGDDESADSGATGAQGASGAEGVNDVTAEEFLAKLLPEKQVAIEAVAATEPECEGIKVEPSLVLVISEKASEAEPETTLTELVTAEC